jgi:hypothetical protein
VTEQILRLGRRGAAWRPFCQASGIGHRGYSRALQRALTDFGAEESFARAASRVKEHYGIEVPSSAVRRISYAHGKVMMETGEKKKSPVAGQITTQMDGSMIPIVQAGAGADRRKQKTLVWREVRLCCARADGQAQPIYGATLGSVENASWLWGQTAQRAGLSKRTYVHGVGDGAPWIVERFGENFGRQGKYLLDFYHVSEYLAGAAPVVAGEKKARAWLRRQQGRLLNNQWAKVLRSMRDHQEPKDQEQAPVRAACRYLEERTEYLDYLSAGKKGLDIGSGEIESGHRHVIQQRLKLAGSWWKETNAQRMLNLRTARANNYWNSYWNRN